MVEVQCMQCRHKWSVGPFEVPEGEMPSCPKCCGIGLPHRLVPPKWPRRP